AAAGRYHSHGQAPVGAQPGHGKDQCLEHLLRWGAECVGGFLAETVGSRVVGEVMFAEADAEPVQNLRGRCTSGRFLAHRVPQDCSMETFTLVAFPSHSAIARTTYPCGR